jgi:hypothetical protein
MEDEALKGILKIKKKWFLKKLFYLIKNLKFSIFF